MKKVMLYFLLAVSINQVQASAPGGACFSAEEEKEIKIINETGVQIIIVREMYLTEKQRSINISFISPGKTKDINELDSNKVVGVFAAVPKDDYASGVKVSVNTGDNSNYSFGVEKGYKFVHKHYVIKDAGNFYAMTPLK